MEVNPEVKAQPAADGTARKTWSAVPALAEDNYTARLLNSSQSSLSDVIILLKEPLTI